MTYNSGIRGTGFDSPKITVNPPSLYSDTRKETDLEAVYQYVPTLKQSGFIIGNPIAYTNQPFLPQHMSSPRKQIIGNSFTQSQSPGRDRDRSNSRIVTHITYGNLQNSPPQTTPHTTYYAPNHSNYPNGEGSRFVYPGSTFVNSPSTSNRPISSSMIQHKPINHSHEMVPRSQYERCLSECRSWEQKYNKLVNSQNTRHNQPEQRQLSTENQRLREKLRRLESKQQNIADDMEEIIISLVNKYRQSTLKECMLLADRYRLERKANQRI